MILHSAHRRSWLGGRKGIRPVKNWVVGCWHGYLSWARCRLPLILSCFSKIQIGYTFLVPAHPGPGQMAVKRVCVKKWSTINQWNNLFADNSWQSLKTVQSAWMSSGMVVHQPVGYYVTRECASCGILWCRRRTPLCRRRTNHSVSGRVQL